MEATRRLDAVRRHVSNPRWNSLEASAGALVVRRCSSAKMPPVKDLTVGQIKHVLDTAGVDFRHCLEKSELIALLKPEYFDSKVVSDLNTLDPDLEVPPSEKTPSLLNLSFEERSTITMFQKCSPSVVHITTSKVTKNGGPLSLNLAEIPQGTGSGFLWDEAGHVVTNFHVIKDAQRTKVTLADHSTWDATLVGYEAGAPDCMRHARCMHVTHAPYACTHFAHALHGHT